MSLFLTKNNYKRREMEEWLMKMGIHPNDIKKACDFLDSAKKRDDIMEKEIAKRNNRKYER